MYVLSIYRFKPDDESKRKRPRFRFKTVEIAKKISEKVYEWTKKIVRSAHRHISELDICNVSNTLI